MSLLYSKSDKDPDVGRVLDGRSKADQTFLNDVCNAGVVRTVELVQSPRKAIQWYKGAYSYRDVNVSNIQYNTAKDARYQLVVFNGKAADVEAKWAKIKDFSENYPYAEQPGWDNDPKGTSVKKWPNSFYDLSNLLEVAAGKTNNSNSFVLAALANADLPTNVGKLPYLFPGRNPPTPVKFPIGGAQGLGGFYLFDSLKPFDPKLMKAEWPKFPAKPPIIKKTP